MAQAAAYGQEDEHGNHTPGFFTRWFYSTNHKDIGTLYILFAIMAGLVGGALHQDARRLVAQHENVRLGAAMAQHVQQRRTRT